MNKMILSIFLSLILISCGQNTMGTSDSLVGGDPYTELVDTPEAPDVPVGHTDSFDEDSVANWECVDRDNWDADNSGSTTDDCETSFAIGGGQLTITSRGADVWSTTHQFNGFYKRDLTGDFDFSVQIVSFNTSPNGWAKFGFYMANDTNDLGAGGYVMCAQTIANRVALQYSVNADANINGNRQDGTNSMPKYLRMKKEGNNITCFYKENISDDWTAHSGGVYDNASVAGVFDVGLIATSHNPSSELIVVMDDFMDLSL